MASKAHVIQPLPSHSAPDVAFCSLIYGLEVITIIIMAIRECHATASVKNIQNQGYCNDHIKPNLYYCFPPCSAAVNMFLCDILFFLNVLTKCLKVLSQGGRTFSI